MHPPDSLAPHCSEALVYLPDNFMAATRAPISAAPVSRAECGMPEHAIVSVNFNAHYKFGAEAFAA